MKKLEQILDFLVMANPPSLTNDLDGMRLEDADEELEGLVDTGADASDDLIVTPPEH